MRKKVFIALRMAGIAGQEKLQGIFRFLGPDHDWDITLVRTAADFSPERMRAALTEGYDGFIVSIPGTEPTAALLADADIPTVVMDLHDPNLSARQKNIVFIRNRPDLIGRAAADFLLGTGRCRSYAFVHTPKVDEWSVSRYEVFRETLRDHDIWCHELKTPDGLQQLQRPIGIFAANDDRGFDVLEYCRAHRIRVPEDALVIGINNDTLICENCRPRLTSIQPDFNEEGYQAAKHLARMMQRRPTIQQSDNPTTFYVGIRGVVHRDSTAPVSQAGKLVQKAVTYIRKNALDGITVEDVARHLGCSRRLADLRFRQLQSTSIGEMILSIRLEEARRLLTSTNMPIDKIAADCGYANVNSLRNIFKRRYGISMRDFRRQDGENAVT